MQNWGADAVAPAPLISHKKCSNSPKLEPIIEEGSENFEVMQKEAYLVLPLLLPVVLFLFLHSEEAWHGALV